MAMDFHPIALYELLPARRTYCDWRDVQDFFGEEFAKFDRLTKVLGRVAPIRHDNTRPHKARVVTD